MLHEIKKITSFFLMQLPTTTDLKKKKRILLKDAYINIKKQILCFD